MKRFAVIPILALCLALLAFGCKKQEEEKPIPRAPITPQVPAEPMSPQASPQALPKGSPQGAPHGDMGPKVEKSITVPDDVKKKWTQVKLALEDKTTKKTTEYTIKVGSEYEIPGTGLKVVVGEFVPDFKMDQTAITSASNEPNNPAVKVEVFEKGNSIFKGWLYTKFPLIHPFEHKRYTLTLKEGVKG